MKKKRILLAMIALLSAINLCACGDSSSDSSASNPTLDTSINDAESNADENSSTTNSSEWKLKYYTDEYGDKTSEQYISYITEGTFSNSATSNSPLYVKVMVDEGYHISFALYEYKNTNMRVTNSYSKIAGYDIKYKQGSGKTGTCYGAMEANGGDYILFIPQMRGYDDALSAHDLKTEQIIKFVVSPVDRPSTKYNFSIDTTGFKEVLEQMS